MPDTPETTRLLVFVIGGKSFGVEVDRIVHIMEGRRPVRTPRSPAYVEGIMDHQGEILPVINLPRRLGAPREDSARAHLITDLPGRGRVAVTVEAAVRVIDLPADALHKPPPKVFGIKAEFIRGVANVGGRPLVWLDLGRLLSSPERVALVA